MPFQGGLSALITRGSDGRYTANTLDFSLKWRYILFHGVTSRCNLFCHPGVAPGGLG